MIDFFNPMAYAEAAHVLPVRYDVTFLPENSAGLIGPSLQSTHPKDGSLGVVFVSVVGPNYPPRPK